VAAGGAEALAPAAPPAATNGSTKPTLVDDTLDPGTLWPGVGSKVTQPTPGKNASTHACASLRLTTNVSGLVRWPVAKPTATRAGMPLKRSNTAMAPAKCWQ